MYKVRSHPELQMTSNLCIVYKVRAYRSQRPSAPSDPQHKLIYAKRNDSRGQRPNHMGSQASIQSRHTFLLSDQTEALQQARVFGPAILHRRLTQSRSNNLRM